MRAGGRCGGWRWGGFHSGGCGAGASGGLDLVQGCRGGRDRIGLNLARVVQGGSFDVIRRVQIFCWCGGWIRHLFAAQSRHIKGYWRACQHAEGVGGIRADLETGGARHFAFTAEQRADDELAVGFVSNDDPFSPWPRGGGQPKHRQDWDVHPIGRFR